MGFAQRSCEESLCHVERSFISGILEVGEG